MTKQPIASIGLTSNHSINIYGIEHGIDDMILFRLNDSKMFKRKLNCNEDGNVWFAFKGMKLYLSEAIAV